MLIDCPPRVNDDDVPAVKVALPLVFGSVFAWLETMDIPTLQMMEQDLLGRTKTGNFDHITNPYVSHSSEMKKIERLRARIAPAENWARIVFRRSFIETLKEANGLINHQRFYGHIVKTIATKESTEEVAMRD